LLARAGELPGGDKSRMTTDELEIRNASLPGPAITALARRARTLTYTVPATIYHCVEVNYGEAIVGVIGDGARGAISALVEFEDGVRHVISRNALRRVR